MYIYLFNVLKNKADVHPLYLVAAVTYPFTPASAIDTHRFYSLTPDKFTCKWEPLGSESVNLPKLFFCS